MFEKRRDDILHRVPDPNEARDPVREEGDVAEHEEGMDRAAFAQVPQEDHHPQHQDGELRDQVDGGHSRSSSHLGRAAERRPLPGDRLLDRPEHADEVHRNQHEVERIDAQDVADPSTKGRGW